MARIVYRGAYATFPMVGLTAGDLAYATDLLILYEWNGVAWMAYYDYPDYQGGKLGLRSIAEWAAFVGEDASWSWTAGAIPAGASIVSNRNVLAGRTLYVTQVGFVCLATAVADADNNQMCLITVRDVTAGVVYGRTGGNGGGFIPFPTPIVVPGGNQFRVELWNRANHFCDLSLSVSGYEI